MTMTMIMMIMVEKTRSLIHAIGRVPLIAFSFPGWPMGLAIVTIIPDLYASTEMHNLYF